MDRSLAKSPIGLLAFGLWVLACPASSAQDDDPNALHQQLNQLIGQGKYQEAIPIAERAVEAAKRTEGPDHPKIADALNYLFQEVLRIRQKILGPEHPDTAISLNNLGALYWTMGEYAKVEPLDQEALRIRQKVLGPEAAFATAPKVFRSDKAANRGSRRGGREDREPTCAACCGSRARTARSGCAPRAGAAGNSQRCRAY